MSEPERILIADDEETFLHATADLLRQQGYHCDCAPDAQTAVDALRNARYDLLIADIRMPGNPALELVRHVRDNVKAMPVILVTGYPSLQSAISSIQLPVAAYLVKPVDFDQLQTAVRTAIDEHRLGRAVASLTRRLDAWRKHLADIESAVAAPASGKAVENLDAFAELTFNNVLGALADMRHIARAHAEHSPPPQTCHLFNCPRLRELTDAIQQAVDVLEKTKQSFKSREIAELRKKLQKVIDRPAPPDHRAEKGHQLY